jgi:anti-anti-sigma factor
LHLFRFQVSWLPWPGGEAHNNRQFNPAISMQTVLIIDDEAATLTMFRLFLNAYGYSVLTAENGERGLRMVDDHRPAIVFTDLKMPGMDGFEVLKRIKKTAPETEVIVITGHGDMDHAVRALNLDATDFINKPISRKALDAALKRAEGRLKTDLQTAPPIQMETVSGVAVITIRGTLTGGQKQLLMDTLKPAADTGTRGVVISFADYSAVNGAGMALLTRLITEKNTAGTRFLIAGLSENFRAIFDMVGITRVAPCVDTVETAIAEMTDDNAAG